MDFHQIIMENIIFFVCLAGKQPDRKALDPADSRKEGLFPRRINRPDAISFSQNR
jgi:hypothetical protein